MVEIVPLARRSDLVGPLVAVFRREWADHYAAEPEAETRAEFEARALGGAVPLALVAVDGGELVGSVSLAVSSIDTHRHLGPWIAGLWTAPERRGAGLGAALVAAAEAEARRLGLVRLYAATISAESLFRRAGWERFDDSPQHGQVCAVLRKDL